LWSIDAIGARNTLMVALQRNRVLLAGSPRHAKIGERLAQIAGMLISKNSCSGLPHHDNFTETHRRSFFHISPRLTGQESQLSVFFNLQLCGDMPEGGGCFFPYTKTSLHDVPRYFSRICPW
jgi:hypothetical protein